MAEYTQSVEIFNEATDIFRKLAEIKPKEYLEDLSACYYSTGDLYTELQQYVYAEELLMEALNIQLKLAEENPDKYQNLLAHIYMSYGYMLKMSKRYVDAEEVCKTALELFKRLVIFSPDVFEHDIAIINECLGEIYAETGRMEEAKSALNQAISLYEKHGDSNPALKEKADKVMRKLMRLSDPKYQIERRSGQFTDLERDIALLLTQGATHREIARKYNLSAEIVNEYIKNIHIKIAKNSVKDNVTLAVADEYSLTKKEVSILRLLHRKATNDEIASDLFLSRNTVKWHIRNLLIKLPIDKREDVPKWLDGYNS
jgi:DNA-binding NarL/FixJ family response regulator